MNRLAIGVALGALLATTSAFAQTSGTGAPANSGPGVQGPPDTRTGPSTKGVGPSGTSQPWDHKSEASSSGSSVGTEGSTENTTSPNQDSSGIKGAAGGKGGPTEVSPKSAGESARHTP